MKPYVKLPSMNWFAYEKLYTGSLGTDPMRGCASCTTFHYRVRLMKREEQSELVAVCYFQLPWGSRTNITEFITGIFEASEFGIEVAENWILSQYFMPYTERAMKQMEDFHGLPQLREHFLLINENISFIT